MLPHTDWHLIHIISLLLRFTFLCYKIIPTIMMFSTGRCSSESVADINSLGFITTLWGSQPSYFQSYLTAKETGPEKSGHLPKATEFLSSSSGVAAQAVPESSLTIAARPPTFHPPHCFLLLLLVASKLWSSVRPWLFHLPPYCSTWLLIPSTQ